MTNYEAFLKRGKKVLTKETFTAFERNLDKDLIFPSSTDLSGAFVWSQTPQGHAYWAYLSSRIGDVSALMQEEGNEQRKAAASRPPEKALKKATKEKKTPRKKERSEIFLQSAKIILGIGDGTCTEHIEGCGNCPAFPKMCGKWPKIEYISNKLSWFKDYVKEHSPKKRSSK